MISRCCCPLWLNIQTKSVSESVFVYASLGLILPSRLPKSSTCSPPKNALHPVGLQGRLTNTTHTPRCGADVHPCTFLFSSSVFVLVLERLRGNRQLGHFHVDHGAGGVQRAEGCLSVSCVSLCGINTF